MSSLEHRPLKPLQKLYPPGFRQASGGKTESHSERRDAPKKTIDISTNVEKATSVTTLEHL